MFRAPRPNDRRSDKRVRHHPGQRHRGHVSPALGGVVAQSVEAPEDALVKQSLIWLGTESHARTLGERLAGTVLSGQPAAGERAEGRVAEALILTEREQFALVEIGRESG